MNRYQVDTIQGVSLIYVLQTVLNCVVLRKICATPFLISCALCLWDAVGYFLGRLDLARTPRITGGCARRAPRHSLSYVHTLQINTWNLSVSI